MKVLLILLFINIINGFIPNNAKSKLNVLKIVRSAGVFSLANDFIEFLNKILNIKSDIDENSITYEPLDNDISNQLSTEYIDNWNYSYFIHFIKHTNEEYNVAIDKDSYYAYVIINHLNTFDVHYIKLIPADISRIINLLISHDINISIH